MITGYSRSVVNMMLSWIVACFALFFSMPPAHSGVGHLQAGEYEIKAVCLYKFLEFIAWPPGAETDQPVIIGIVGTDRFGDAFSAVENRPLPSGQPLEIRRFGTEFFPEELRSCAILFIDASEKDHFKNILSMLNGSDTLTVSDTPGFLEAGGMFNFLVVDGRIRWEINRQPLDRAGLRPNAQLFNSSVRVISVRGNS